MTTVIYPSHLTSAWHVCISIIKNLLSRKLLRLNNSFPVDWWWLWWHFFIFLVEADSRNNWVVSTKINSLFPMKNTRRQHCSTIASVTELFSFFFFVALITWLFKRWEHLNSFLLYFNKKLLQLKQLWSEEKNKKGLCQFICFDAHFCGFM